MEVIAFISFFVGASWDFFTEVQVPGFEFSFAALFVGLFLANLGLRFVFMMLGIMMWWRLPVMVGRVRKEVVRNEYERLGY